MTARRSEPSFIDSVTAGLVDMHVEHLIEAATVARSGYRVLTAAERRAVVTRVKTGLLGHPPDVGSNEVRS